MNGRVPWNGGGNDRGSDWVQQHIKGRREGALGLFAQESRWRSCLLRNRQSTPRHNGNNHSHEHPHHSHEHPHHSSEHCQTASLHRQRKRAHSRWASSAVSFCHPTPKTVFSDEMNTVNSFMPEMTTITYRNVGAKMVHAIFFATTSIAAVVTVAVMIKRNKTITTIGIMTLSSALWIQIDYGLQRAIYHRPWFPPRLGPVISHILLVLFVSGLWVAISKATGGSFQRCGC